MIIYGRLVKIRGIEEEDLPLLLELMNDVDIETMTVGDHFPMSMYEEKLWYSDYVKSKSITKFIVETEKDGVVGLTSFEDIDWRNRSFQIPIKLVRKPGLTLGIGIDTHMAMLRYAFDYMQMHRAFGRTLEYNKASLNMQKRCGYVEEGRLEKAIFKNGKYHDLILTRLFANEYYEFIKKEKYWN